MSLQDRKYACHTLFPGIGRLITIKNSRSSCWLFPAITLGRNYSEHTFEIKRRRKTPEICSILKATSETPKWYRNPHLRFGGICGIDNSNEVLLPVCIQYVYMATAVGKTDLEPCADKPSKLVNTLYIQNKIKLVIAGKHNRSFAPTIASRPQLQSKPLIP